VKCFWALPGERALSTIKTFIINGGNSFDKNAIIKMSLHESATIKKTYGSTSDYFKDLDSNGNLCYSDQGFSLRESKTLVRRTFTNEQINEILLVYICEIKKKSSDAGSFQLYQLFLKYQDYRNNMRKANRGYEYTKIGFYEYINELSCANDPDMYMCNYATSVVYYFTNTCVVKFYRRAKVYGTDMTSLYEVDDNCDYKLIDNWNNNVTYSSWFKFRSFLYENDNLYSNMDFNLLKENYVKDSNYKYGQFKFYFKIDNFVPEPSVSNNYFASARVFNKVDLNQFKTRKVYIDMISIENDIDETIHIISLNDVFSTRILTCGVDSSFLPIKLSPKVLPKEMNPAKIFSMSKFPHYLLIFEMNANRKNINTINYDSN
jgi:hypothetical protein